MAGAAAHPDGDPARGQRGAEDSARIQSLLSIPRHLLFEVGSSRGTYATPAIFNRKTDEALVLPAELAGIVPGATLR